MQRHLPRTLNLNGGKRKRFITFSKENHSQSFAYSGNLQNPKLDWYDIIPSLYIGLGKKLLILDCCNAAMSGISKDRDIEVLCASVFETSTTANLQNSFTRHLIDTLKEFARGPFTIADINAKMVERAIASGIDSTPWHGAVVGQSSITLYPPNINLEKALATQPKSKGYVLVKIYLGGTDSMPQHDQFVRWFTERIPEHITGIKIDASFQTSSANILVTMPITVWTMLSHSEPGFEFVAHVRSRNLLAADLPTSKDFSSGSPSPLALRPENVMPGPSRRP